MPMLLKEAALFSLEESSERLVAIKPLFKACPQLARQNVLLRSVESPIPFTVYPESYNNAPSLEYTLSESPRQTVKQSVYSMGGLSL
jgi:hypothetical protein